MNQYSKIQSVCFYSIIIFLLGITSCSSRKKANVEKDKDPIVSVYDKTLYRVDLEDAISERLGTTDSTQSAEAYIKMWINEELIYEKAKQNVADQDRINELVENYRQSLVVFTYLEQLLKEELSKKLSDTELKDYYDKNPDSFKLGSSLIKGLFLKVPRSSSELNNLRQWYKQNTEKAKESIEKASIQNTVIYDYFYDKWISIDDVLSNMPIPINDVNQFVKSNKNFEAQDSSYVYLLHIEEYALAGTNAPFVFAKPQITDILINKNRESFLKRIEEDLYDKAVKEEDIKYYIDRQENTVQ
ncbi:peptidyl-prolyl cis-trans isomerase [Dysgonomonas sp. OttesenSCG-928-M03]|nr:peptidyl-prolyl cis-trans isomerase [Dysgonomonas sp. OttesenSCG-928-M03]